MKAANNSGFNVRLRIAAFTLIELLVVISVISILMAIAMPSLNKAKESGKSAVCLSNLRNLTIAWVMYAEAYNGKMCSSDTDWTGVPPWEGRPLGGPAKNSWVSDGPGAPYNDFCNTDTALENGVLWPYLETHDIYRCPSERKNSGRSYGISHAMGSVYNINLEQNYYNISEIPMLSQKLVFIDTHPPVRCSSGYMNNLGSIFVINTYFNAWAGFKDSWPITDHRPLNVSCRHNNGTNMSFADGRVEHWKWMDYRTIKVMNDKMSSEEASIDNPDIKRLLPAVKGVRDRQF